MDDEIELIASILTDDRIEDCFVNDDSLYKNKENMYTVNWFSYQHNTYVGEIFYIRQSKQPWLEGKYMRVIRIENIRDTDNVGEKLMDLTFKLILEDMNDAEKIAHILKGECTRGNCYIPSNCCMFCQYSTDDDKCVSPRVTDGDTGTCVHIINGLYKSPDECPEWVERLEESND
jgi:hypothetical protein